MVYFIGSDDHPYVKIGYSDNLVRRLTKMQADSPFKLKVLRQVEGDRTLEKLIQNRFAPFHVRGEWYQRTEVVLQAEDFNVDGMKTFIDYLILDQGIFPTKENVKKLYPNLNWSKFKGYSEYIKTLCLKKFGCASFPLYCKLVKASLLKEEGYSQRFILDKLNISTASYFTIKNKLQIFSENK